MSYSKEKVEKFIKQLDEMTAKDVVEYLKLKAWNLEDGVKELLMYAAIDKDFLPLQNVEFKGSFDALLVVVADHVKERMAWLIEKNTDGPAENA